MLCVVIFIHLLASCAHVSAIVCTAAASTAAAAAASVAAVRLSVRPSDRSAILVFHSAPVAAAATAAAARAQDVVSISGQQQQRSLPVIVLYAGVCVWRLIINE